MGREGGREGGREDGSVGREGGRMVVWGGRREGRRGGGKEVTDGGVWREREKEGNERVQVERDVHVHFPPDLLDSSFVGTENLGCSLSVPLPPDLLLPLPRSPSGVSPSKEASPRVMGRQLLGAVDQASLRASLSSRGGAEVRW